MRSLCFFQSLMMKAVDLKEPGRPYDGRCFGTGRNAYAVELRLPFHTVPFRFMIRQVLNQPASKGYIQQLHTPADG